MYIRTEIENQEKLKRLKDLQQKNDEKNQKKFLTECTFSPNSVESLTRNHEKFVNDCYAWSKKRSVNMKVIQADKEKELQVKNTDKPKLNKTSELLAKKVRHI